MTLDQLLPDLSGHGNKNDSGNKFFMQFAILCFGQNNQILRHSEIAQGQNHPPSGFQLVHQRSGYFRSGGGYKYRIERPR